MDRYCEMLPGGEHCENVARFRVKRTTFDLGKVYWCCAWCFDVAFTHEPENWIEV
jgi:hypothetical protein